MAFTEASEPGKAPTPTRIAYLDGLRGAAIIFVVLFHAYFRWNVIEPFEQPATISDPLSYGWLGVELFFAISGFVIYMTLLNARNIMSFAISRYLRLAPAMIVASVVIYLSSFAIAERPEGPLQLVDFLPSLTFLDPRLLSEVTGLSVQSLDGAFWSLYVEVKFYAAAALLFFVCRDRNLNGIYLAYLFFCALFIASEILFDHAALALFVKVLSYLGLVHYGWFLLGILSYKYYVGKSHAHLCQAIAIAGIASAQLLVTKGYSLGLLATLISLVAIFLWPLFSPSMQGVLANRVLLFFGYISYPLYLVHQNLVTGLAIKMHQNGIDLPAFVYPLPFIVMSIGIAYLIALSEPAVKALLRRAVPRGGSAQASVSSPASMAN